MLKALLGLGLFGLLTSSVFTGLVIAGAIRFIRRKRHRAESQTFQQPVSLLKPLHGAEPNLDIHLESFFLQDYPSYEILFCARSATDTGLAIARQVASRYPQIPVQFLIAEEPVYINAKVSSLERMAAAARHDLFIISDSDVRVTPDYIRSVVAPFADANVGAVTCLYRGVADKGTIWSKLEAAGMSIEMTSGVLVADMMEGMQFTLGPTMAVRRPCVDEIGGFRILGPYCADDFVLGNQIAAHGHTVVLSTHVIDHVILNLSFTASQKHQIRWMKSTRFSRPKGHFGTALTFSVPFGLLSFVAALALHHPFLASALLLYSLVIRMLLAAIVGASVVEERHLLRTILLYPLRDFLGFCYWMASYGSNKILWRGEVYRLMPGGLMHAIAEERRGGSAVSAI
ncbi:bacteriohopanetetrol glucosamine biosynthesis glycosyltransferase HpnI [Paracidobacterium acidisoli]|uniref:Glycosyltransferase n=1 Tax=Paracidobacterium acidisoli TaxID=2303751 RepID=A0A372IP26_9BACT|nr:bacteriohopanetetrol glucosamine biosynthesis glycosyltransferase HpnI [Paracidobacterium acidisoli]MBT9330994.1 bacteriohopanetetrol glucosamine biosynthesis glycosyltransferase HpnI [Paracidobacterium acidisoli]